MAPTDDASTGMAAVIRAIHRGALRAYPPAFRRQFGADLERVFDLRVRRAGTQGALRSGAMAAFLIGDALLSGAGARIESIAMRWAWPHHDPEPERTPFMTLDSLSADVRLALRRCRQAPIFAALIVGSLGLGIGANSAIFSVVHAVLLRPLPYADPDRLLMIWSDNTRQSMPEYPVSPANFEAFKAAPSLAGVEAMYSFLVNVQFRVDGDPEVIQAATITPGMFALLGRGPALGGTFDEQTPGVVLSDGYWRRRFAADPGVIGRTVTVNTGQLPILGVMPADFSFPYRSMLSATGFSRAQQSDVWLPLTRDRDTRMTDATGQLSRTIHYFGVVGRLRPEADQAAATGELQTIARTRAGEFPDTNEGFGVTVRSLHQQTVGAVTPALMLLLGGVAIVLLITCINVANVLLARATSRQLDLSIRSALGASERRLVQQALVESLILSGAGGLAGLAIAFAGLQALLALAPANLPRLDDVRISGAVLTFTLVVALVTGLVVGALPAMAAARSRAQGALRDARSTPSRGRRRVRAGLIVAEVALAMTLAIGAGLLFRSFVAVLGVDPGFQADRLLTMQISLPSRLVTPDARLAFYDDLEARLKALPGVTHVGGTTRLPLGSTSVTTYLDVEGRPMPPAHLPEVELRRAVFDYFDTMGIPVLRGRDFTRDDDPRVPIVGIVNATLAARVFPNENPVGQRVRIGSNPNAPWIAIVGVIGSVLHGSLEEAPKPELYLTYRQGATPVSPFLTIRAAVDAAAIAPGVRQAIRAAGANPPFDVRTMAEIRSSSVAERRFVLLLVGLFGALALALAAVGVYGIITLVAEERTAEVGLRLALGASPRQVLTLVLGHAVRLTLAGVIIGAVIALVAAPALGSQLFNVRVMDPMTYAAVAVTLLVVASVAAYLPARRAMQVDPSLTLRGIGVSR